MCERSTATSPNTVHLTREGELYWLKEGARRCHVVLRNLLSEFDSVIS